MASQAASIYARAAFEYASEQGEVASWSSFLERAAQVFALSEVKKAIQLRLLSQRELLDVLDNVLAPAGETQQHLLWLLADKKRLLDLPDILSAFLMLCAEANQEMAATVSSVVPLAKTQLQDLAEALSDREGQSVKLDNVLDPTLLGGFIVRMGDKVIDRSLGRSLLLLQKHMLG